jgi:hypothetical protein
MKYCSSTRLTNNFDLMLILRFGQPIIYYSNDELDNVESGIYTST